MELLCVWTDSPFSSPSKDTHTRHNTNHCACVSHWIEETEFNEVLLFCCVHCLCVYFLSVIQRKLFAKCFYDNRNLHLFKQRRSCGGNLNFPKN